MRKQWQPVLKVRKPITPLSTLTPPHRPPRHSLPPNKLHPQPLLQEQDSSQPI